MLKLSQLAYDTYKSEVDYYTPLTIECSGYFPYMQRNYFRLISDNSLLEIGINPDSNQLMNIILVQVSNAILVDDISIKQVQDKEGIPIFSDNTTFTNGLYDMKQSFDVFLSKKVLKIQLFNDEGVSYLSNGRVKLGFSQDKTLVNILLVGLTCEEYEVLKDCFEL